MDRPFHLYTEEETHELMNTRDIHPYTSEGFYQTFTTLRRFRQALFIQARVLGRQIGKEVLQNLDPSPREAFRAAIEDEGANAHDMEYFLQELRSDVLYGDSCGDALLADEGLMFLGNLLWAFSWRVRRFLLCCVLD